MNRSVQPFSVKQNGLVTFGSDLLAGTFVKGWPKIVAAWLGASLAFIAAASVVCGQTPNSSGASSDVGPPSLWTRGAGEDWPQFLGPRGDGTSQETGLRWDWPKEGLPIVWWRALGTSYGIGVVEGGRYFQFCRYGNAERLTCLVAETGKELWRAEQPVSYQDLYGYNDGPRSSPVVHGSSVYTFGVAGRLTCYDVRDGRVLWTRSLHEDYGVVQNFFGAGSSPIIVDDLLLVMVGGSPAESQRIPPGRLDRVTANDTAIVAFDPRTGQERWHCGADLASYSTPKRFDWDGRTYLAAFCRDGLQVIDIQDGTVRAEFPWRAALLESVNAAVPVVQANEIFLSECYEVGAVLLRLTHSAQPQVVWQDPPQRRREQALRAHWATPILIDGYLYGASGRNEADSDFRCIRWSDGAVQWVDPRRTRASALAVDGHLVVLNERGLLEVIRANPQRMERVAQWDLGEATDTQGNPWLTHPCWAAPILSHGLLWIRGEDRLLCLDLRDPSAG